jgi:hypothetical protein
MKTKLPNRNVIEVYGKTREFVTVFDGQVRKLQKTHPGAEDRLAGIVSARLNQLTSEIESPSFIDEIASAWAED